MKINFKNSFLNSIFILASGSIIAQLITVIASPFLTRLFSSEEIGVYTYILSIATIFMSVINGRYDMSIVTEEKEERIYPLIKLSIIICIIASIVITLGYTFYIAWYSHEHIKYLYTVGFIFVLLLTNGVLNVLTAYNNRKKEYKTMSSVYVIRTAYQNIGAVLMGLFKTGLMGLLLPYTVGQLMGINRQAKSLIPNIKRVNRVRVSEMLEVLKLHYKQPLFSAPAIFANSFSYSSITIYIESLFGMSVVGYYSISVRLLGIPMSIVSGNVSRVFFEEASREYNETNQFYNSFRKTFLILIVLAIPMVTFMMVFAPLVFGIVFGEEWAVAGKYVVILAPMFGIRFIVSTISPGMIIANKQNLELFLQIGFIVASIVSLVVSKSAHFSIEYFLVCISFLFSITYICYFIAILKCSRGKVTKVEKVNF